MEEQNPPPCHSHRMQNKPPLPPEATPNYHPNHNKMQAIELGTSGTTSGPPPNISKPESFVPLSSEPNITSIFVGDIDTIET